MAIMKRLYSHQEMSKMYLRFQGGGKLRCPSCMATVLCDEETPDDAKPKTRYYAFICQRCGSEGQLEVLAA